MERIKRTTMLILAVLVVITMMPVSAFAEDTVGGSVAIDEAHFPDQAFRSYITYHFDKDKDGALSQEEIEAVENMELYDSEESVDLSVLTSLDGLKYFTNLKDFKIYGSDKINNIHYIDFTANKSLVRLSCSFFWDSAIDINIKGLDNLEEFHYYSNYEASELDITGCTKLIKSLDYPYGVNNQVVTYNYIFETGNINTPYNNYLMEIDGWTDIFIDGQKTFIDGGIPINKEYFPDPQFRHFLRGEMIGDGNMAYLDSNRDGRLSENEISKYTNAMIPFSDDIKSLKGIEYLTAIEYLYANDQTDESDGLYIEELDLSALTKLKWLSIEGNPELKALDVTGCTELERIEAENSGIRELDLRNNTKLDYVDLSNDPGIVINIAGNTKLISAVVYTNDKAYKNLTGEKYNYVCEYPENLNFYVSKDHEFLFKRTKHNIRISIDNKKLILYFNLKKQTTDIKKFGVGSETHADLSFKSGNPEKISIKKGTDIVTVKAAYVGKATITVTAAANEAHTQATDKFMIYVLPDAPGLKSVANTAKGKITVKWSKSKSTKCTGYKIQYSTSKKFTKATTKTVTVKGISKVSKVISKLKKGKTYHVRMRTYLVYGGETYYSPWTVVKSVKIKK